MNRFFLGTMFCFAGFLSSPMVNAAASFANSGVPFIATNAGFAVTCKEGNQFIDRGKYMVVSLTTPTKAVIRSLDWLVYTGRANSYSYVEGNTLHRGSSNGAVSALNDGSINMRYVELYAGTQGIRSTTYFSRLTENVSGRNGDLTYRSYFEALNRPARRNVLPGCLLRQLTQSEVCRPLRDYFRYATQASEIARLKNESQIHGCGF